MEMSICSVILFTLRVIPATPVYRHNCRISLPPAGTIANLPDEGNSNCTTGSCRYPSPFPFSFLRPLRGGHHVPNLSLSRPAPGPLNDPVYSVIVTT